MFPFVCLSSLVLFCDPDDLPLRLFNKEGKSGPVLSQKSGKGTKVKEEWPKKLRAPAEKKAGRKEGDWRLMLGITTYICIQLSLPFSHGITKVIQLKINQLRES